MKFNTLLLLLGLATLDFGSSSIPALARAETTIEDLGETVEKTPESGSKYSRGGAKKTPEEREALKK